jgi:hypothetical protein
VRHFDLRVVEPDHWRRTCAFAVTVQATEAISVTSDFRCS